jgi:hypothetical protein
MTDISFSNRVKKYFDFLVSEYGFKVTLEKNSDIQPQTDGAVEYISAHTGILIDSETGYATVRLYRIKDGKKYYLTPIDIYEYLNTNEGEKKLLLSTNPAEKSAASALFNEKFLLNQPGWKGSHGSVDDLDKELQNFSHWLKAHASICIEDNFSRWSELYEYKIQRARADLLRRGKDDQVYTRVRDDTGNFKLVKQSAFKDELEYIEKLKKEFLL